MSIYNDDRRFSKDPEEYESWRQEVQREARRDSQEYFYPDDDDSLVLGDDDYE